MTKDEALKLALEALNIVKLHFTQNRHVNDAIIELEQQAVQEPVACRFCHSKKGCWTWQCYTCDEIDDVQQPALPLPVQEPVGYVKGTYAGRLIYDTINPAVCLPVGMALYTAPLPVQEPTPWRDMVVVSLVREGINKHKARELADHFAAQPVQEPIGEVVEVNNDGFKCEFSQHLPVGTKLYTTPPPPVQEPWGACVSGRVFVGRLPEHARKISEDEGAPIQLLYTAPPQRPWVGLTEQDMPSGEDSMFDHQFFIAGMVYAAKILQEKNT